MNQYRSHQISIQVCSTALTSTSIHTPRICIGIPYIYTIYYKCPYISLIQVLLKETLQLVHFNHYPTCLRALQSTYLHVDAAAHGLVTRLVHGIKHLTIWTRLYMRNVKVITIKELVAFQWMGIQHGLTIRTSEVVVARDIPHRITRPDSWVIQGCERTSFTDWVLVEVFTLIVVGTVVGVWLYHVAQHLTRNSVMEGLTVML